MKNIDFSLWCDFIERGFLQNEFQTLIKESKFVGATSNPSIFANAILHSNSYQDQRNALKGKSPKQIYEALAIEDIRLAAQILEGLYKANKDYGYISIEIDPQLCHDTQASIKEGKRLYDTIGYENVMIKVPATQAGYEVMGELFASGINVNATLIFSQNQARQCAKILNDNASSNARAVISVFVSRFDSIVPSDVVELGILNAMLCYYEIEAFKNPNIRTLFASTGAKIATLPKDYYITNLITPHTINTAPLATIESFLSTPSERIIPWLSKEEALAKISHINLAGRTLQNIQDTLLKDGLESFQSAFSDLLKNLA